MSELTIFTCNGLQLTFNVTIGFVPYTVNDQLRFESKGIDFAFNWAEILYVRLSTNPTPTTKETEDGNVV